MKETILQFFRENFLGSRWFTGWASLISIIGVLYGLYKDWAWSKKGIPFYALRTFPLLSSNANAIPGLKVLFNGKNVKSLSSTKFILWNGGHDVIRKEDIPSGSQIQLELKEEEKSCKQRLKNKTSQPINSLAIYRQTAKPSVFPLNSSITGREQCSTFCIHAYPIQI